VHRVQDFFSMNRYRVYIFLTAIFTVLSIGTKGQNKPSYEVEMLGISSSVFDDMSPVIVADGIVFCSNRRRSIVSETRTWSDERLYDIYFSLKTEDGTFSGPKIWSKEITSNSNDGPLCFTPDGKSVYFTRNTQTDKSIRKRNRVNKNGIFIADRRGDTWTNIRPFEYNNPDYNLGHPSISSDGKYLFFTSDMPGGKGRFDIYYCEYIDGKWGQPVNAGDKVNTRYSEGYPGMHTSGRLYFSSDRPASREGDYGGLDIYYSMLTLGQWSEPVLLDSPINSSSDDFAFTAYPDGQNGYFTSARGRSDDIYRFSSIVIRQENCDTLEVNSFCYEFYEENAIMFDTIPFQYEWDFGDGHKGLGVRAEHCFDGPGKYTVKLNSLNLVTKEIQYNEVTIELDLTLIEQPYITAPDTCIIGEQVLFSSKETNLPGWNIVKYYWNFDDETIAEGDIVSKVYKGAGAFDVQLMVSTEPDRNGVVRESCITKRIVVLRSR
jgi:hypothetical protein